MKYQEPREGIRAEAGGFTSSNFISRGSGCYYALYFLLNLI
jgi:hypothetical protein